MTRLKVLRPGSSKKICFNDMRLDDCSKRLAVQTSSVGKASFLLLVSVGNNSGFGSEAKILEILGKDPMPRVRGDIALGRRERLLEMPAGPGPYRPTFTKFELMTAKEAKAAMKLLEEKG